MSEKKHRRPVRSEERPTKNNSLAEQEPTLELPPDFDDQEHESEKNRASGSPESKVSRRVDRPSPPGKAE